MAGVLNAIRERKEVNLCVSHNRLSQVVPKLPYLGEHSEVSQAWSLHACWARMPYNDKLETMDNSQSTNSAKTLKIFNVYSRLGL